VEHGALFPSLRVVVIDELHAFAGDDRGWHLLAVLERVTRIAGGELQRIGLSATIGNPDEMLSWLAGHCDGERRVIAAEGGGSPAEIDVVLDHVGSLANAARVIATLHRGEKRLVFCDSRAQVEELSTALREAGNETYVSHSSLSLDERQRAEQAFVTGSDCVIVATSTLELGVDVGDLDRVIQVDAPFTVAAFLQRLGRTGRRAGTLRNCLFLTTTDVAFLRASGLLSLWAEGYVDPVQPPPRPLHILAQQLLALAVQEGRFGRRGWRDWLGRLEALPLEAADEILDFMLGQGMLFDEADLLSIGPAGEASFGWRSFTELTSAFASDPAFQVRHGSHELGSVHPTSLSGRTDERVLLLSGRRWAVRSVDWSRRRIYVEPTASGGRSRWVAEARPMRFELCRAIRDVLTGARTPPGLSQRGHRQLEVARDDFDWVPSTGTAVRTDAVGRTEWWTFAGLAANRCLAEALGSSADRGGDDNLSISVIDDRPGRLAEALRAWLESDAPLLLGPSAQLARGLKFAAALPAHLASQVVANRAVDREAAMRIAGEPLVHVLLG
jgi:ATP-dependent Lhr-like helicase